MHLMEIQDKEHNMANSEAGDFRSIMGPAFFVVIILTS